ncbi:MAG: hypothetical protein K8R23_19350 [Chthoniobacter sp.]|nr:hypothetical protein [Chthoniobacter sp.]
MKPVPPRVVVPSTTKRDACIAIIAGLLVLAFLGYGIMQMGRPGKSNELTGIIVAKEFTPQKERQITFSGRKLKSARETDGEYVCKVRVAPQNRIYDVPVEKDTFEARKVGDKLTFLRPESEQE